MDKSQWPQEWKDQYNQKIKARRNEKLSRAAKNRIIDDIYCPRIHEFKIDEQSIFAMLAYHFPLHPVIKNILQRFIDQDYKKALSLSPRYLYETQNIFPGYYSDRERIVAMMNRFKATRDINEFIEWVQFQTNEATFHYLHFLIGIILLDHYLENDCTKNECLDISIHHLEKAAIKFVRDDSKKTSNGLIAFGHYLNRDFERSASYLQDRNNEFQNNFVELIKKVA
ncbi:MAG: hypothetical protein H0V66_07445 [Bdellovibrionales bacterium]|nr:hypothetical protein [Bdellovibrionales bacterium]